MRLFILAILVTAFIAVTPQDEGRTRPRGLRRFSLSSPALKAAKTTEDKGANELVKENVNDPATPSEPRTRTRGSNPLRRGRPGLRLRGRTDDLAQEATVVAVSENTNAKSANSETDEGARGGGLRIRRPLKKITTTTTTTTTTTESPVAEEIATELFSEIQQTASANEHANIKEEIMLIDELNAVIKDEVMQNKSENMEKPLLEEEPIQEEVISEPKTEKLPQMKKLRPIPIKIRRRGKVDKSQPEESPKEEIIPVSEHSETADAKQVSSHRFSPRPRPRLQARRRPINKESTTAEIQQDTDGSTAVAEQEAPLKSPQRLRSRGDVPNLRKRPSRISLRQRPGEAAAAEIQPEGTAVEEPIVEDVNLQESQPVNSNTGINQEEKLLKEIVAKEVIDSVANKRVRIRPRIQKPSTSETVAENQRAKEQNAAVSDSHLEAPLSDAVRTGRPGKGTQIAEKEKESQQHEFPIQSSKFRTPNYGGSDLIFKSGDVKVTQIGTIEDTPIEEIHTILSGFGSRRRGLGRPKNSQSNNEAKIQPSEQIRSQTEEKHLTDSLTASTNQGLTSNVDLTYDYYEY